MRVSQGVSGDNRQGARKPSGAGAAPWMLTVVKLGDAGLASISTLGDVPSQR